MHDNKSSRPHWTQSVRGVPFECVARLHPERKLIRPDLQVHPHRVSLVRTGQAHAKSEDVYELSYCYNASATNEDVFKRSLEPYVDRLIDGYNVNVVAFGTTGSGKRLLLDGTQHGAPSDTGIVQHAIDDIFRKLHASSIKVGSAVAANKRAVTSKSYAYYVETSFVEAYEEAVHDLYAAPSGHEDAAERLPIVEDPHEGWVLQGARLKIADSADEARAHHSDGAARRWVHDTDVGNVQEHAAAYFSVAVYQYWPSTSAAADDRVLVSRMRFVCAPGAERMVMDPALLRIREGPTLNQSLVSFCDTLQVLHSSRKATPPAASQSVMTRLLADSLGGNALTLMIGTLQQGELAGSEACLKYLQIGAGVETFPASNNNCVRGLLHGLRLRLRDVSAERQALLQQLDDAPEGAAVASAATSAKLAALIDQNVALQEESAAMVHEKGLLQEQLKHFKDSVEETQGDMREMQEALIASEEKRLEVGRALLDFRLEHTDALQAGEEARYELQQKVLNLEARLAEAAVTSGEGAALEAGRSAAHADLAFSHKQLSHTHRHVQELLAQVNELEAGKHALQQQCQEETLQLRQRLLSETSALHEKLTAEKRTAVEALEARIRALEGNLGTEKQDLAAQLRDAERLLEEQRPLVEKGERVEAFLGEREREMQELKAQVAEAQRELGSAQRRRTVGELQVGQLRDEYSQNVQQLASRVAQLARAVQIHEADPESHAAPSADELQRNFEQLQDELVKTHAARESDLVAALDGAQERQVALRAHLKALALGYRQLRYQVEDAVASGGSALPTKVVHENQILGGTPGNVIAADEDADRRSVSKLSNVLGRLNLGSPARMSPPRSPVRGAPGQPSHQALVAEIERLRNELSAATLRTSPAGGYGAAASLNADVERLRAENARLQAGGDRAATKHIVSLERQVKHAEARALLAEKQLEALNAYMAKATHAYQSEIMRLKKALPRGGK